MGGHNQAAPQGVAHYLPYQTSIIEKAGGGEQLLVATRRIAAKNPLDWDSHWRNRNRRGRRQTGWDSWILGGMQLIGGFEEDEDE